MPKRKPLGWITTESLHRLRAGGNDSRGTVPIHRRRSRVARHPVSLGAGCVPGPDSPCLLRNQGLR